MDYKIYKKSQLLLDREIRHKDFLKLCKELDITPNFLKIHNKIVRKDYKKEVKSFERRLLNKCIRKRYAKISKLEEINKRNREVYIQNNNPVTIEQRMKALEIIRKNEERRHQTLQSKKLNNWCRKTTIKSRFQNRKPPEIPYLNLSSHQITVKQDRILKKGPRYIFRKNINLKDLIPKIETLLEKIPSKAIDKLRSKTQNRVEKAINNHNYNSREEMKIIKEIKDNNNIVILHTDKTNKIAVMDRNEYNEKMQDAINSINAEEINKDPTDNINNKVKELAKNPNWPQGEKLDIVNKTPIAPIMFGKIKDHKNPMKMRPIVNKRTAPTYKLENYMKTIYAKLLPQSDKMIKSTKEFIDKIRNLKIKENEMIVSFDIKELYPSINIEEIQQIINTKLKEKYEEKIAETLIRANNLLLLNSYFQFNNKLFKQKKGVPMGSPISQNLSELKIRILEEKIIEKYKEIKYWIRYVDDIFAIIDKNKDIDQILQQMNQEDKFIKFTIETENNNMIPFLDTLVIRKNEKLETTVYRKPTLNTIITPNVCDTPYRYKIAPLRSYINRALLVCSNDYYFKEEIDIIKKIAETAGYNPNIIDKLVQKIKNNQEHPKEQSTIKYIGSISHIKGVSDSLIKDIKKLKLGVASKPNPTLLQLLRTDKQKQEEKETAGIYQIKYLEKDTGKIGSYIGMTSRKIKTRIKEHMNDIKYNKETTGLTRYNKKKELLIDFQNINKLANYNNMNYAYKREAIEILTTENTCNDTTHAIIDKRWQHMLRRRKGERSIRVNQYPVA